MKKQNILLTRRFTFSSAHRMWSKDLSVSENTRLFGKCQNIHGHNYTLEVTISGKINYQTQCIINLNIVRDIVNEKIVSLVDHQYLNEVFSAKKIQKDLPVTLENLGFWIWKTLREEFKKQKINLDSLRLWESENNSVTFTK